MLKIRLKRFGKKHRPFYRVSIMPARSKRDGMSIEDLGHYDPINKDLKLNSDRIKHWMSVGAVPTYTVERLLVKGGVVDAKESTKKAFKDSPKKKSQDRKAKKEAKTEAK